MITFFISCIHALTNYALSTLPDFKQEVQTPLPQILHLAIIAPPLIN